MFDPAPWDDELVERLKAKLQGKDTGAIVTRRNPGTQDPEEKKVLLTRSDKHGNLYPVRSKTTDNDSDDDNYCDDGSKNAQRKRDGDLKAMVEEEHLTSVDDHQQMTARLASKHMRHHQWHVVNICSYLYLKKGSDRLHPGCLQRNIFLKYNIFILLVLNCVFTFLSFT